MKRRVPRSWVQELSTVLLQKPAVDTLGVEIPNPHPFSFHAGLVKVEWLSRH